MIFFSFFCHQFHILYSNEVKGLQKTFMSSIKSSRAPEIQWGKKTVCDCVLLSHYVLSEINNQNLLKLRGSGSSITVYPLWVGLGFLGQVLKLAHVPNTEVQEELVM